MSMVLTLAKDPNPLDPPLPSGGAVATFLVQEPPLSPANPLSVAQYNGFREGVMQGSVRGVLLGALCGIVAYWLVRRYA